jgi:hypothetical protein
MSERERRTSEKLSMLYTEINPIMLLKLHKAKHYTTSLLIIYFVAFIGIILTIPNTNSESKITSLDRPTNGEEASSYELNVEINGETTDIVLEIESKAYTLEEVLSYFDSHLASIESTLIGDNPSLYEITDNLNFISNFENIDISWQVENYDYINIKGEILMENIPSEGATTNIYANLKYGGHSATITFPIFIQKETLKPSLQEEIMSEINKNNDPHSSTITLPDSINGNTIYFSDKAPNNDSKYFF